MIHFPHRITLRSWCIDNQEEISSSGFNVMSLL
jgi:hypothetical protein